MLSISDNGAGIDETVKSYIFEPFFTTKNLSESSGLSLASAHGVVQQHGGWIECESELGDGVKFTIYLPAVEAENPPVLCDESARSIEGTETILLIDDEQAILDVGKTLLEKFGYTVMTAKDGRAGLTLFLEKQSEINLIILDIAMPHLSGREILERLRLMGAKVRVLLSSGLSMERQMPLLERFDIQGYVTKPYHSKEFVRSVREALDRDENGTAKNQTREKTTMVEAANKIGQRILAVDDEAAIGRMLRRQLAAAGYECQSVACAEAALSELQEVDYCLVISDINMPGMNGVQLLERIADLGGKLR